MQTKLDVLDYLKPLPPRTTVTEALIQQIISLIKQAGLQPGDRLPSEKEIIAATKASRPSVREALRALKTIGVIETRPGAGSFLGRLEPADAIRSEVINLALMNEDFKDIVEARRVLECAIVRRIVRQGLRQIPDAERILQEMAALAAVGEDIYWHSTPLHLAVAKCGGSPVLEKLVAVLFRMVSEVQRQLYRVKMDPKQVLQDHWQLYRGIVSGDEERAVAAVNAHLDNILETLTR
jgi:GntR family transcriptional repressor for pyruvate dehydrogenase complex